VRQGSGTGLRWANALYHITLRAGADGRRACASAGRAGVGLTRAAAPHTPGVNGR